jgi:hypothetical protein
MEEVTEYDGRDGSLEIGQAEEEAMVAEQDAIINESSVPPEVMAAAATLQKAIESPMEMAAMNAELRSAVKGAHALIHALVKQFAGTGKRVTVPRADWQSISPAEELEVITDDEGNAILYIRRVNRAERRRK